MIGPVQIAREAWGPGMPEWVLALANACAASSQNRVAKQINRSPALVSNVLRNRYGAGTDAIEELVRGALMKETVSCPQLGDLPVNECREWRERPFSASSRMAVTMFRACATCPFAQAREDA